MLDMPITRWRTLQQRIRYYYESATPQGYRFRYGLLSFDLCTIVFIVATSFIPRNDLVESFDVLFGLLILADIAARLIISPRPLRDLMHPASWADVVAVISFLAPLVGEGAGVLRILRTLRLLRTYQLLARLRADISFFRRHEEVIITATHLAVFDASRRRRRALQGLRRDPKIPDEGRM